MNLDDDDAAAILLEYALRDLDEACHRLARPEQGWLEFLALIWAVLRFHPERSGDLEQLALSAARRVRAEILYGL